MENPRQEILDMMEVDNGGVLFGDGLEIETENGSLYRIDGKRVMTCIRGKRAGLVVGKAMGAVYRGRGPIRPGKAVIGLRIEASRGRPGHEKLFITTPIISIKKL